MYYKMDSEKEYANFLDGYMAKIIFVFESFQEFMLDLQPQFENENEVENDIEDENENESQDFLPISQMTLFQRFIKNIDDMMRGIIPFE